MTRPAFGRVVYNEVMPFFSRVFAGLIFAGLFVELAVVDHAAMADVIVLANRASNAIPVQVKPSAGSVQRITLAPGDSVPVFVDGRATVAYAARDGVKQYTVDANTAYYFGETADRQIGLQQIGLGEDKSTAAGRKLPGTAATAPLATIPVKIYVDEEEPARQPHWERRLRDRIEAASQVLKKHAGVELKVVAVGTWDSDDTITDFFESLGEFERDVKPFPGRLAIGFTSQYQVVQGRTHMAGTRGALSSHILVREWSRQMSEPERLELLVHELGHFLGASHSPEQTSVMRPVLGDRQAVRKGFQVRFDPVNTLVMSMVGEELRRSRANKLVHMSLGTKVRLRQIYQALSPTMPDDPAANHFVQSVSVAAVQPLLLGTKQVVATVAQAAQTNLSLPEVGEAPEGVATRRTGDELMEYYVRQAAGIARFLPEDIATSSFLMGLGIALDDSTVLRDHPKFGNFVKLVEPEAERSLRLVALGQPTILGRRDLAQHFVVSSYLAAAGGTQLAITSGLMKEMADSNGGSGFSFVDMAANRAGILFAGSVLNKRVSLQTVGDKFTIAAFMPSVDELPEGLTATQMLTEYGPQNDDRFQRELKRIDQRLLELPTYRNANFASSTLR